MQEDGPELGAATPAAAATPGAEPIFTEDDLINFSDVDDEVPLATLKGKGKERERDIVKVKEEPSAVSLGEHGPVASFVSLRYLGYPFRVVFRSCPAQ